LSRGNSVLGLSVSSGIYFLAFLYLIIFDKKQIRHPEIRNRNSEDLLANEAHQSDEII